MTPAEEAAKAAADKQAAAYETQLAKDAKNAVEIANAAPVVVVGRPGGTFNIDGQGFGTSGILTIGEHVISTTMWDDRVIKGQLPLDARGTVALKLSTGTRFGVYLPKQPPPELTAEQRQAAADLRAATMAASMPGGAAAAAAAGAHVTK